MKATGIVRRIDHLGRVVNTVLVRPFAPARVGTLPIISSRSRYTDFEGKRRKITDDVRA